MTPSIALTIAGSDCSSGAGIQADLKTFSSHGCHGLTALTCVVAETPDTVKSIHPVPPTILKDQVEILLNTYRVDAIKTGMLFSKEHLIAIVEILSHKTNIPLVVDPVMVATSGSSLVDKNAIQTYRDRLLPLATLITPNMPEAAVLLGQPVEAEADLESAAKELSERYQTSVLLKGGHLPGNSDRLDILWHNGKAHHFTAPKIDIGCTPRHWLHPLRRHHRAPSPRCQHDRCRHHLNRLGPLRHPKFLQVAIPFRQHHPLPRPPKKRES